MSGDTRSWVGLGFSTVDLAEPSDLSLGRFGALVD